MGSTSDFAIPYPDPTAPNAVPTDVQALAVRVAAVIKGRSTAGTLAARPAVTAGEVTHYLATDVGREYVSDGTAWYAITPVIPAPPVQPAAISWRLPFAVVAGLVLPQFIAPFNMTLRHSYARLDSGSGVTYRLYVNGIALTDIPTSAAVGTTVVLNDFTDHDIAAGDTVQPFIVSAGTSANGLSLTAGAVWR